MCIFSRGILAGSGKGMGLADTGSTGLIEVSVTAAKIMDKIAVVFVI